MLLKFMQFSILHLKYTTKIFMFSLSRFNGNFGNNLSAFRIRLRYLTVPTQSVEGALFTVLTCSGFNDFYVYL